MPLEIFAIIVPLGIAAIVLIVKYSGLSKSARLSSAADALGVFESDFGGEIHKGKVVLTNDQGAAFIQMDAPTQLGLVEAFGDRFISRVLGKHDLISVTQTETCALNVGFNDFTHPSGKYVFDNENDRSNVNKWLVRLEK